MIKIIDANGQVRECVSVAPDKNYPGYVKADFESKIRKGFKHSEWYLEEEFYKNNPKLKPDTSKTTEKLHEDVGVVSMSGDNYLQDNSKNWEKNIYQNTPVWISRGKGEGQQRNIIRNDKNKLYIDKKWKIKPDTTSQYVISYNVQDNIEAVGNTLPGIESKDMFNKMIKKAKKNVS